MGDFTVVTVAIVGTGSAGNKHLKVLQQMPGVLPIAIPMRPARIHKLEDDGYATVRDLSEAVRMGVVLCIIATDTGQHLQDGLSAVERGLDILVEKPLSTDALQASRLCLRATEASRKVFVGCVLRFSESLSRFREWLGNIGRLHSVRIECQSYLPDWRPERSYRESYSARADEGGVLRDLIHEIDYAGWIFGWPVALQARVRNLERLGIASDEIADLIWETPEGCLVSVSLDYLSRPSRRRMRATGEFGTVEWDGIEGMVTLVLAGGDEQVFRSSQTLEEMLLTQDLAFVEASRGNHDTRLATGEDGVRALAVCDAARQAAETRCEEKVNYI